MGIYDREYYRDETRGSGWLSGLAPACKALILINVGVFLAQWILPNLELEKTFALQSPLVFEKFQVWRLVTAIFLHDRHSILHLILNMWALWIFGREMEAHYGRWEFTGLFLGSGIFGNLCWALINYFGPSEGAGYCLGASGAVMGVLVIYATYYPSREVLLFVVPVPVWLLVVLFLGFDLFNLVAQSQGMPTAAVAFASHLGGGLYGYMFRKLDLRWSRILSGRGYRPRLRVVTPETRERDRAAARPVRPSVPTAGAAPKSAAAVLFPEEQLDARVDEILAKIARDGRGSLTEEENRILQEASRRARDRRSDRV